VNISDEAVEAAAKANYEARTGKEWRFLDNFQRPIEIAWMRIALEAAEPYLCAAEYKRGFGEGYQEGFDEGHLAGQESMETE
jgi:hypothetical protein